MRRQYKGAAQASVLTAELSSSTTDPNIYCNDLSNWPDGSGGRPFFVVSNRGKPNEEKILCESRTGNVLKVYDDGITNGRAADGTSATTHAINSVIEHIYTATDADEANLHVNTPTLHVTVCTSGTRPATPTENQLILETDTLNLRMWNGADWVSVSSSAGGFTDLFLLMGA